MKKQFEKLALTVVFAMLVSMLAPTVQPAEAATKKTFTYAEQITGDTVTTLFMDKGEKVDLRFVGVTDWKNYKLKWTSSNEKVATVNNAGVITAHAEGEAVIELNVGDGSVYTSTGVKVYVGQKQEVTIGTASTAEIKSYTLEMGKTVTLKANGLKDNVAGRYTFEWSSTDTSVARVSDKGVITTVKPGLTVIQLTVKKVLSGETMEATPIAVLVKERSSVTPSVTLTPTPTPTKKPEATLTPTATPTPTPTPVPSNKYVAYTAKLESDKSILLTFESSVDYKISDIELYQLIIAGNSVIPVKWEIANVTADSTGKKLQVEPVNALANGERYLIKAGSADTNGTTLNVVIGAPNRMELTYECLGKSGVAYAYDESAAIDVPVTLSYRLYYGAIDVTETYRDRGYISYDFATNKYYDNVGLDDNVLTFYAPNVSAAVTGTYTYYDSNGAAKEVKSTVSIKSQKLPKYGIREVVIKSTIIDDTASNLTKIDWDNTTNQVVAYSEHSKLVVMVADTYGNYYVNDERGVDASKKIYSVDDPERLFSQLGYSIELSAANPNQIIIGGDGSIYPFKAASQVIVIVTLTNNGMNGSSNYSKNIGACPIKVLEESKLDSVTSEESRVTLAASALSGYEDRFCTADVEILLKDQYGNKWDGDYNLELSSALTDINDALGSSYAPAKLEGNILHIDAENIKRVTNRTAVTFYVTETTTKKKVTINVTLQNPTVSNGEIKVSGWSLGLQNSKISIGEPDTGEWIQYAAIEAYKLSSNSIKVGLYDNLKVLETANYSFTTSNCRAGEVYVLVKGPNGKVVAAAENENSVGVYVDEANHCVKVNVSAPVSSGSLVQTSLAAGTYTVTATRIVSVGSTVQKVVQTAAFTVVDNTKNVTFRSLKSASTPLTVSGTNDQETAKAIVESVLSFNLGGEPWTAMNASMITNVEYLVNGKTIVIRKVEFAVPVNSNELYGLSYKKTCDVNKAIKIGVSE